ncbi:hypothetical protein [Rhodococcoides fascians]|uniref:hypothetical protein n=1 Tax=Rhodococcoides fascians TaxID=1828 RepID=UPI001D2F35B2|nr:hypothetical protein [Rhodococcus fascians]CAH0302144.1 hypothetical protein SRABI91_04584 [Rhodococcus fascians]
MGKLTPEQLAKRRANAARKQALWWEEGHERNRLKKLEWDRLGTSLTYDELMAGVPCRGCGEVMDDQVGDFGPTLYIPDELRPEYERRELEYKAKHAGHEAHRWLMPGSRQLHCGYCCPPPPMSPQQGDRIAKMWREMVKGIERRGPDALVAWNLELTCGHSTTTRTHKSAYSTGAVAECEECGRTRGVVSNKRQD